MGRVETGRWEGLGSVAAAAAAAPSQRGFALHQILLPSHRHARPLQNQNMMDFWSNTCPPPLPTIPLDCSYHRTRLHLTSRDSFVDCSPSAQRAHKAPGASSTLALINISEQSFPTGDPQQTMTHPSGFHLRSPY